MTEKLKLTDLDITLKNIRWAHKPFRGVNKEFFKKFGLEPYWSEEYLQKLIKKLYEDKLIEDSNNPNFYFLTRKGNDFSGYELQAIHIEIEDIDFQLKKAQLTAAKTSASWVRFIAPLIISGVAAGFTGFNVYLTYTQMSRTSSLEAGLQQTKQELHKLSIRIDSLH